MKCLFLTPVIPYPLEEGGKISQFAIIDNLRFKLNITIALAAHTKEQIEWANKLKVEWQNVNIVLIDLTFSLNIKGYVFELFKQSVNILRRKNSSDLSELENHYLNRIYKYHPKYLVDKLTTVINECSPDIIQIDFIEYLDLALIIPAHIKKVFIHHELRFARFDSMFSSKSVIPNVYEQYLLDSIKNQEIELLKKYDCVSVFSENDKDKLKDFIDTEKIEVNPFPVLDSNFVKIKKEHLQIKKLVFVGSEGHSPNKDAVEWYISELGPSIFDATGLKLYVTGKWTEETKRKYKNSTIVVFAGFVDNLIEFCKNSIMVVPVRIGSGIRTKIIYAMAQGVPVVSATIGVEGIPVVPGEEVMIANNRDEFVDSIKIIKTNQEFAYRMVLAAQQKVSQNYSQKESAEKRKTIFAKLLSM